MPKLARDGITKKKSKFHEDFNFERQHSVSYSLIALVGVLDMIYAFLLFWPANGFPIWLMVSLLQFYIPLSIFIRYLKMGLQYQRNHYLAAALILVAIAVNLCDLAMPGYN